MFLQLNKEFGIAGEWGSEFQYAMLRKEWEELKNKLKQYLTNNKIQVENSLYCS